MSDDTELALAREFMWSHPVDAALVVERHPGGESSELLAALPPRESAPLIEQLAPTTAAECLAAMPPRHAGEILSELSIDAAAMLLRRLPTEAAQRVLDAAPEPVLAAALRMLVTYPEGTAGAVLDPTVLAVPSDVDVREALDRVLREARHTLYYVYVVDRSHRLAGVLSLRELMQAKPDVPLAEVMHPDVECLRSRADVGEIVAHPGWREHHALPVVDDEGKFLGAIRYRTLRRLERHGGDQRSPALAAAVTLSELYWYALSRLLEGVGTAAAGGSGRQGSGAAART